MARGRLLQLEKLPFDRPHACHQTVELGKKKPLILLGSVNEFGRRAVANALEGVCQLHVQEAHGALQIDELLM